MTEGFRLSIMILINGSSVSKYDTKHLKKNQKKREISVFGFDSCKKISMASLTVGHIL